MGAQGMGWFGIGELTAEGQEENSWSGDYVGVYIYQQ